MSSGRTFAADTPPADAVDLTRLPAHAGGEAGRGDVGARGSDAPRVDSEVGVLRSVILHRPDIAHQRLRPRDCRELRFDEVIWVRRARREFDGLADLLGEHRIEVLLLHELLAEALRSAPTRDWLLPRRLRAQALGAVAARELAGWMTAMDARELATHLTGGVALAELPEDLRKLARVAPGGGEFALTPLPGQLFARDAAARIHGGVMIAELGPGARRGETLNLEAVYRFHPRFAGQPPSAWLGGADAGWDGETIECADVMALGDGVVLVGHDGRTTLRATTLLAERLFALGEARIVIAAPLSRGAVAGPLDSVMTFCDRDVVTINELAASGITPIRHLPDGEGGVSTEVSQCSLLQEVQDALGLEALTAILTGGEQLDVDGEQWDDGNNILALAPGSVVACERNERTNRRLAKAGIEVHAIAAQELGRCGGAWHRMAAPVARDP